MRRKRGGRRGVDTRDVWKKNPFVYTRDVRPCGGVPAELCVKGLVRGGVPAELCVKGPVPEISAAKVFRPYLLVVSSPGPADGGKFEGQTSATRIRARCAPPPPQLSKNFAILGDMIFEKTSGFKALLGLKISRTRAPKTPRMSCKLRASGCDARGFE